MLLALLIEGEGIAAHVLNDLGVTLEKARAEIEHLLLAGPVPEPIRPTDPTPTRFSDEVALAVRLAGAIAASHDRDRISPDDLRMALDVLHTPAVHKLLDLGAEVRGLEATKQDAIARQDFEAAARARDKQRQARQEFARAEEAWKRTLKRRRKRT
jgi:hypothetical protein